VLYRVVEIGVGKGGQTDEATEVREKRGCFCMGYHFMYVCSEELGI
jgi:hypothetical protein